MLRKMLRKMLQKKLPCQDTLTHLLSRVLPFDSPPDANDPVGRHAAPVNQRQDADSHSSLSGSL